MLWKCCNQYASKSGKLSSGHRTGKGQFSFQSQRKAMPKNVQTSTQLHSSHTLVKKYSKFSRPGFNSTWTTNFQVFKLVLEKAEEPDIRLPISIRSLKKQESSRKASISALLVIPKSWTVWIIKNYGKFWMRWEYQTTWSVSWKSVCRSTVKTGHGTTDWFQIGKGVHQGCILSPCLFNLHVEYIMQNAGLDEHKLESRLLGEISITSDMQMTPPLWQKVKRN